MNRVEKLRENLERKVNRLRWANKNPLLFVTDHFFELRSIIDIEAETLIKEKRDAARIDQINENRNEFLRILKELENATLKQISTSKLSESSSSSEAVETLEKRLELLKESIIREDDISDIEEAYVDLGADFIRERDKIERLLLGEQSIVYMQTEDVPTSLGLLVYFPDDFLNAEEVNCLNLYKNTLFDSPKEMTLDALDTMLEKSLNSTLQISIKKSFTITKTYGILYELIRFLLSQKEDLGARFLFFGKREQCFGYSAAHSFNLSLGKKDVPTLFDDVCLSISNEKSLAADQNVFEYFSSKSLHLEKLDMIRLDMKWAPSFDRLKALSLNEIWFESSDLDLLSHCVNLKSLSLTNNVFPNNKYDLGFLGSCAGLESLSLSLPDSEWDFESFERFDKLTQSTLQPAFNAAHNQLSKTHLVQISAAFNLKSLNLSNFEIESIEETTMKGFRELTCLSLNTNRILHIDENTFSTSVTRLADLNLFNNEISNSRINIFNSSITSINRIERLIDKSSVEFTSLTTLSLSKCGIEVLAGGVFDGLVQLNKIDLSHNQIRKIMKGTFEVLASLYELDLSNNPIGSIENNAFCPLIKLNMINLDTCQLTSINNLMFNGLISLESLNLSHNLIASIDVIDESNQSVVSFTANLASEEFARVEELLFRSLVSLKSLTISGNKLDKLDLNYFFNLKCLLKLDLSFNLINELNRRAHPGLFPILQCLNLENNQLTFIDKEAFSCLSQLNDLLLASNKLERLADDFFAPFVNLSLLDLRENSLSMRITEATFESSQNSLNMLCLNMNTAIEVTVDALRRHRNVFLVMVDIEHSANLVLPSKLIMLDIHRAELQNLRTFVKTNQSNLGSPMVLNIRSCKIQKLKIIDDEVAGIDEDKSWPASLGLSLFEFMKNGLLNVDLSGNLIESLDQANLFASFPFLDKLILSDNRIRHIHHCAFNGLPNLTKLDLSKNCISRVDPRTFRHLGSLTDVSLRTNRISSLDLNDLFRRCESLRILDLADNQLDNTSITEASFSSLRRLRELILANNCIEKIDFIRCLHRLTKLDLRNNKINSLEPIDSMTYLNSLRSFIQIDLQGNQIRRFREDAFARKTCASFYDLDLSNNPLEFDSVLSELL